MMAFQGHVLMENRSGLVVAAVVTHADGLGERAATLVMLDAVPGKHPKTVVADKVYDTRDFIAACRQRHITPHVASNPSYLLALAHANGGRLATMEQRLATEVVLGGKKAAPALPKRSLGRALHRQPVRSTNTTTSKTWRAGLAGRPAPGFRTYSLLAAR